MAASGRFPLHAVVVALLAAVAGGQVTMSGTAPPVLGFIDISGTGLAIAGVGDDTSHAIIVVTGNALFPSGNALFGNDGVLIAGLLDGVIGHGNEPLPASGLPIGADLPAGGGTYLFPFWDDLVPNANVSASNTTLYAQLVPGAAIFMWKNETHYGLLDDAKVITFEVQIFTGPQTSCTPLIQFVYPDTFFGAGAPQNDGASATIGGVFPQGNAQFSFNTASIQSGVVPQLLLPRREPHRELAVRTGVDPGELVPAELRAGDPVPRGDVQPRRVPERLALRARHSVQPARPGARVRTAVPRRRRAGHPRALRRAAVGAHGPRGCARLRRHRAPDRRVEPPRVHHPVT